MPFIKPQQWIASHPLFWIMQPLSVIPSKIAILLSWQAIIHSPFSTQSSNSVKVTNNINILFMFSWPNWPTILYVAFKEPMVSYWSAVLLFSQRINQPQWTKYKPIVMCNKWMITKPMYDRANQQASLQKRRVTETLKENKMQSIPSIDSCFFGQVLWPVQPREGFSSWYYGAVD